MKRVAEKCAPNLLVLDLHCGNIAVDFSFLHTKGVADLLQEMNSPICKPCLKLSPEPPSPHVPLYIVDNCASEEELFYDILKDAASAVFKIIDFGAAFRPTTDGPQSGMTGAPQRLRAPETTIAMFYEKYPDINDTISMPSMAIPSWSPQSDIWTLGCALVELYSHLPYGFSLFNEIPGPSHFYGIARLAGPIPPLYQDILYTAFEGLNHANAKDKPDIQANWSKYVPFVLRYRRAKLDTAYKYWSKSLLKPRMSLEVDTSQVQSLFDLVQKMIRWDPRDRISIHDALKTEFFTQTLELSPLDVEGVKRGVMLGGTRPPQDSEANMTTNSFWTVKL